MPRSILKLSEGEKEWYLVWSTIVDAPITDGMTRQELIEWWKNEYGKSGEDTLMQRLKKADKFGTSAYPKYQSAAEMIQSNRAGDGEMELDEKGIIKKYCTFKP